MDDHLNALQECLSSSLSGGVHACAFSLLAEEMKYSWCHRGIGCRAKSVLTGLSCILKQLSLSTLYKTVSGGREQRCAVASSLELSPNTFYQEQNRRAWLASLLLLGFMF